MPSLPIAFARPALSSCLPADRRAAATTPHDASLSADMLDSDIAVLLFDRHWAFD
jgi:hypothetical protein